MTRTFSKTFKLKKHLWSETKVYTDSKSIQEDSAIIQTHPTTLNPPNKAQNQGMHDCSQ